MLGTEDMRNALCSCPLNYVLQNPTVEQIPAVGNYDVVFFRQPAVADAPAIGIAGGQSGGLTIAPPGAILTP